MAGINSIPLIHSYYNGTALEKYTDSYMISMARTSLGNIQNGTESDYIIYTVCDLVSMFVLFIFYLHWKSFHKTTVDEEEKDNSILNPTSYVLSVVGFAK